MKRAALYVRVSTEEQKRNGISVDSQISALQEYCASNDLEIVDVYNDAGHSARKKYTSRPELLRLMNDCNEHKVDIILFTKLDRWFRSVKDYYEVQAILDNFKIPWRAIWEDYETETSSGIFKVNIMLSVAQSEADRTSERIKAVNEYRRSRGEYVGTAPTGYKVENKRLVKDKEKEEGMSAFFKEYLASFSLTNALREAARFGVTFERSHISRLMKNTAYCGQAFNGYECDSYITPEEHALILSNIKSRSVKKTKTGEVYLFAGLMKCGYCGKNLSGKSSKRKRKEGFKRYTEYVCPSNGGTRTVHRPLYIYESTIENFLLSELDSILEDTISAATTKANDEALKKAMSNKRQLEEKLKRVIFLYEEGDIDIITYRKRRDELKAEINQLYMPPTKVPEPLPEDWKNVYKDLSPTYKKAFWNKVIESISVTRDEGVKFSIKFK